jgi:hypothetical protein
MRTTPEKRQKSVRKYNNTPERKQEMKEYYQNNKEKAINRQMVVNYGITLDGYNELLNKQDGSCYICNVHHTTQKKRLHIDHCHTSGKVRNLLCSNCNTALGLLKEDVVRARKLVDYIEEHKD